MTQEVNQIPPGVRQLHDYAEVHGLVAIKDYDEALRKLATSALNDSTKEQLRIVLESKEPYVIERTFDELDGRIATALCWECWRE